MFRQLRKNPDFLTILGGGALAFLLASGAARAQPAPAEDDAAPARSELTSDYSDGTSDAATVDATALVQRADAIRFPRESFETLITVTNYTAGEAGDVREYKVMSRGNENTIVLTESPASERGQALLMRGRDLWIFMPTVSQPVRLSLSQRLTGQVANGDLARANFAGDYSAELAGRENLDGEDAWVLDLTAAGRGVTYAKVRYWVAVADDRPIKAEFYAVSGRLLKTSRYEAFQDLAGRMRPTRLVIEDALKEGDYSVLEYNTMTVKDLPERMFTQQYLRRL
ncbi:outer membrane lipoprotein-sorting protein [Haliea salexigens]|uniref:outer membrane lipoprotein-sorting protein n=1 Tax=Haliea salexigens TaxID=287487 RepID=UPI0003F87602|nr:outer membrane lipoprotein-sorting protein [Haliea salexigens]|tara:strand:- start:45423 stop:46271 length:849 start_codon:yes stop_codon:yes gene_type:complete